MCFGFYPAKEFQLFPGLGVYSGIFAIYLQCSSNESRTRTANVVFYILCLLYIFSGATVVCDLLAFIFGVSNDHICKNIILSSVLQLRMQALSLQFEIDLTPIYNRIKVVQDTVNACCDFTSQSIIVRVNHSNRICHPLIHLIIKDLSLLDGVGEKHSCRYCSFNLGNHTLRSVDLSSFDKPILIYRLQLPG